MTDVLLVKPPSEHLVVPPLGLGYLSSSLKKQGVSSRLIHCSKEGMDVSDVVKLIESNDIKIVGVSCCSNDHLWLCSFAEELEALPQVQLVVGGPHATGLARRLMDLVSRVDFIIRSEGEEAFPKLVISLMDGNISDSVLAGIPNLIWNNSSGDIIENPVEILSDLDALGFPDWQEMPPREYAKFAPHGGFSKESPVGQIMTTRGCPYGCNYCAAGLIHGRKIRRRSPESIVEEIEYLIKNHGVKEFHLEDDNFTFNKDHVVDVCTLIRRRNIKARFALPNGIRVDRIDDEILHELHITGFYTFFIGIESGSQATLKRMNKALDLSILEETIALIRKRDFRLYGYFIIGYPGETSRDIEQTIEYARSLDLDRAYFTMYIPLPGTREFQALEEEGKIVIEEFEWENFYTLGRTIPPYIPDGMTSNELQAYAHRAYRRFYLRPKIMARMLRDMKISSFEQLTQVVWNLMRLNLSYFI